MSDKTELKKTIEATIKGFSSGNLTDQSLDLFKVLGYKTERQSPLSEKSFDGFKSSYLQDNPSFKDKNARVEEWKHVDLLFQLTGDEMCEQVGLFDAKKVTVKGDEKCVMESYLFFVIGLKGKDYSRTDLAKITREVNKPFPMPAMVLFYYDDKLTLSVINRRLNKKDEQKDVLKKVTLIKDISISHPHRAHVEILFDLSFEELRRVHKFGSFVELHNAWQKTLDTKELNKKFYKELSNWYFWAVQNVSFPNDVQDDKDDTVYNSENIIRMLTRLIFIWFIKEKGLIPESIFEKEEVAKLVKGFNHKNSTVYYRAILQNLFFATLNQEIKKRDFATEGSFDDNKKNYGIKNLYRYASDFNIPKTEVLKLFSCVPFLNGGLFDCLDNEDQKGKVMYLDGFSRNPKKQAKVPDELFFSEESIIDLSAIYDDKKKKSEKVKGLFEIFRSYKFTITENTPVEEEIALDPELLGRVFENLLASYNPETNTTARKQTGSFYTPREIVNYMVDESLKAYLKQKLETEAGMKSEDADIGLTFLLGYNEKERLFDEKQTGVLINALDNCKILDPACGSGAFPMGILHKMVHVLHQLDPQNKLWKERQIEKASAIEDSEIRNNLIEDIEISFDKNELDYGRKLYLIENCIYGVDIQPIATQISKLRFFISLVVDQKPDVKRDNFGIRPLPNLETKFVAANTLIGIKRPDDHGSLFDDKRVNELEKKLTDIRHRLFSARTPASKRRLREEDQNTREEMGKLLEKSGWDNETARQLACWDPYDQNASSPFFDMEWMFGNEKGFDIVIGNPPYVQLQSMKGTSIQAALKVEGYEVFDSNGDIYCLFYEKGIHSLKVGGHLCYITSNKWMRAQYGEKLRSYFIRHQPETLIDLGPGVFESATVDTNILLIKRLKKGSKTGGACKALTMKKSEESIDDQMAKHSCDLIGLGKDAWFVGSKAEQALKEKIERIGKPLKDWDVNIYRGVLTGLNEAFIIDSETKEKICAEDPKSAEIIKPILRGRDIKRYGYEWAGLWIIATFPALNSNINEYPAVKKYLLSFGKARLEQNGQKLSDGTFSRKKTGNKWFETQDQIAYYQEFEKEKIVWASVGLNEYCYIPSRFLLLDTNYFAVGLSKYHLALLNSRLIIEKVIRKIDTQVGAVAFRHYKYNFENIPIPNCSPEEQQPFINLVDIILKKKEKNKIL